MRITKNKDKKYPLTATLSNGTKLKVPKQSKFSNSWLRSHGCSIMAEYLALQCIGKHVWPINILAWHRKKDSEDIKAKVTLRGVSKGINHYCPGHSRYDSTPTYSEMDSALKSGSCVILEQKNPIHSIFLVRDDGANWIINYGTVKKVNLQSIAKTATTSKTYRGMVIVKR